MSVIHTTMSLKSLVCFVSVEPEYLSVNITLQYHLSIFLISILISPFSALINNPSQIEITEG